MKKRKTYSKVLAILLSVTVMFTMISGSAFANLGGVVDNNVTNSQAKVPTAISISAEGVKTVGDKALFKKNDKFTLKALDQDGNETPVKWSTSSTWACNVNESTGEVTITSAMSSGSTTYMYFNAVSTLDSNVNAKALKIEGTGYELSDKEVTLSTDGQTAKTVSMSGGADGHNEWIYDATTIKDIAAVVGEPGKGSSLKFDCYRPGTFDVTVRVNNDEALKDTKKVTIKGVAVETVAGERQKTYLSIGQKDSNLTTKLTAFCEADKTVASWASSNDSVATVAEDGTVTAHKVGVAIITATDSAGAKGGIKVVVESKDKPYFEGLEFMTNALESGAWVTGKTFNPLVMEYNVPIKMYRTSTLTLQTGTLYNTAKYDAVAEYTDAKGAAQKVTVNNGKGTMLKDIPFGKTDLKIVLSDKANPKNRTEYIFHVTRPRDDVNFLKPSSSNDSGVVFSPVGRELSAAKYNGQLEGTLFIADQDGTVTTGTGLKDANAYYRIYAFDNLPAFKLNLKGKTDFAHIRYSIDDGKKWNEIAQSGAATEEIKFPKRVADANPEVKVRIQVIGDKSYHENIDAGKDGYDGSSQKVKEYIIWVEQIENVTAGAKILEAKTVEGEWYPQFKPEHNNYTIVVPNATSSLELLYKVPNGATVKIGSAQQSVDTDGFYKLALSTSAKKIVVTSDKGASAEYSFKIQKKSKYDVPDKVVDYLCINSQYTNGGFGVSPEATLSGSVKSLGNFGGYITYFYEKGIKDNPNNQYGVDFYVYGNSFDNGGSAAESGQVWVSEDGNSWYALAGSEHYEDSTIWNYQVSYSKASNGKTAWKDNQGNSNDGSARAGAWPKSSIYYLNNLASGNEITLSGILLPCVDGTIQGDSSTGSFVGKTSFGYADYFKNGTVGADVNPYAAGATSNGFDLKWAVDQAGNPVDVTNKEFHYVKVVTANNIWAGAFNEKSTEVQQVVRTTAKAAPVGVTSMAKSVNITDGVDKKTVALNDKQQIYKVNLGDMKYVNISLDGLAETANVYVNNKRINANEVASGIKVTKEAGEKLVRIIVQEGDKEPQLIILKLVSNATSSNDLIEGVKVDVAGAGRKAETTDGKTYTVKVGHKIDKLGILPIVASTVSYTVNDAEPLAEYAVNYGENVFNINASDEKGNSHAITLKVVRENAPQVSDQKIKVSFTLYGDEKHGDTDVKHTYKNDKGSLPVWVKNTTYEVPKGSTVLDVFEKAMNENKLVFINEGGNYISSINGLAEFDNGALSGWMYLLNGTHPLFGVAEQVLKSGDSVVFHYTDDYTKEEGSDKWPAPEQNKTPVVTVGASGSAVTTTPTEVVVTGDTANVTVKPANMAEVIKQAKKNNSKEIVFDVKAADMKNAVKLVADIDTSVAKKIVQETLASLTIKSPLGKTEISKDVLAEIVAKAAGSKISFEVAKNKDNKVELIVKSGDQVLHSAVTEPTKDQAEEVEQIKAQLKAMKFKVAVAKTAKKNVVVKAKLTKAQKETLKQIEAAGYDVKYKFYRSTLKNKKYKGKAAVDKTKTSFKTGKYGKKYFYKARVLVYDKDGKLIAKTGLKQCKLKAAKWVKR